MQTPPMNDIDIRSALKLKFAHCYGHDPETLLLEELGLRHGAIRVDLALVNGQLHGFELKSDRDRLDRLPRQSATYNKVFDRMTLVVGQRHADRAVRMIPEWWGVELARKNANGAIEFTTSRGALENPAPDPLSIAKLLWREEALGVLIELGQAKGLFSKPRAHIHSRLAEVCEIQLLRFRVRDRLRNRGDWRSGERQTSGGG
jgi:hypothetical protein